MEAFTESIRQKKSARLMLPQNSGLHNQLVTKVGGVPLWPSSLLTPQCSSGHMLDFLFQISLRDAFPGTEEEGLISFHYCVTCAHAGNPSSGFEDYRNPTGYRIYLFQNLRELSSNKEKYSPETLIKLIDIEECPHVADTGEYPSSEDFKSLSLSDYSNRSQSKLGGWPTWIQGDAWLTCPHGNEFEFVGQIGVDLLDEGPWASGGFGYIWICPNLCGERIVELSSQST